MEKIKKILKMTVRILSIVLLTVMIATLLILVVRGEKEESIKHQSVDNRDIELGGPFESSGSSSRFVLTESIVEDRTFFLNQEQSRLASPDITRIDERYLSIFTPGVSMVGVPFYIVGKQFGLAQLFTYISSTFFAFLNVMLVVKLSQKLGSNRIFSIIAGLLFIFGTNALAYSTTFTQHHASTSIILLGIISALNERTLLNNIWFGILFGAGLLIDIPNSMLMFPLVVYILIKQFKLEELKNNLNIKFKLNFIGLLIGLIPMLFAFGLYNLNTTGSYTIVPQFIGRPGDLNQHDGIWQLSSSVERNDGIRLPFNTRKQLLGFYTFIISAERSIPIYSPIVLFGVLGYLVVYSNQKYKRYGIVLLSVFLANMLTYSMFSDPTGSWSFGPRYLIPGVAILSIGISSALSKFKKNIPFVLIFLILSAYSIGVNVLGAMTTTQVPPKVEAVNLPDPIPYTYEYNWELMTDKGLNSSLFYNLYLSDKLSSKDFALIYASVIFGIIVMLYTLSIFEAREVKKL